MNIDEDLKRLLADPKNACVYKDSIYYSYPEKPIYKSYGFRFKNAGFTTYTTDDLAESVGEYYRSGELRNLINYGTEKIFLRTTTNGNIEVYLREGLDKEELSSLIRSLAKQKADKLLETG